MDFGTILGFFAGIAAKIVGDMALRDIMRPQLQVDFRESIVGCITQTFTTDDMGNVSVLPSYLTVYDDGSCVAESFETSAAQIPVAQCQHFSLRVKNTGRTTAKNCRGFIVRIQRKGEDGRWYSVAEDVMQLNWAFASKSEVGCGYDLLPGMHRFLNVVWIHQACPNAFLPCVGTLPNRWHQHLTRNGTVRLVVQIAADDAESKAVGLEFEWGSEWNAFVAAQSEYDTIT